MSKLRVEVGKLYGLQQTPTGVEETEVPGVLRVDVFADALKDPPYSIESGKLHVGMIGTQSGASFCENYNFHEFSFTQQQFIVGEVNRIHGGTSISEPVKLPDLPSDEHDEDEDEADDE